MRHVCLRAIQVGVLAVMALAVTPHRAPASELGCFAICLYDDWACIASTGHPADLCGYDAENDICNLGACQLSPSK